MIMIEDLYNEIVEGVVRVSCVPFEEYRLLENEDLFETENKIARGLEKDYFAITKFEET